MSLVVASHHAYRTFTSVVMRRARLRVLAEKGARVLSMAHA